MAFGRDCRSTPCTSSEAFLRSLEREEIMREVATRFLGTDYFSRDEGIRLGSIRTSAALGGFGDREAYSLGDSLRDEDIRRINVTAQIANSTVTPRMHCAEIHPKLAPDGRFPRDFEAPKRVEDFLAMDGAPLDRLLIAYQLPRELTSVHRAGTLGSLSGMGLGSGRLIRQDSLGLVETVREAKLRTLFQYLGVDLWEERRGVLGLGGGLSGGLSADRLRLGCDRGRLL